MAEIKRDIAPGSAPWQVQPPDYDWPFLINGDSTAVVIDRFYKQQIADYLTDRAAGRYLPGVFEDPETPGAFLMTETKATRTATALAQFSRTFGKVPAQQIVGGLVSLTRPDGSTVGSPAWTGSPIANAAPYTLDLLTSYPGMYSFLGYYIAKGLNCIFGPAMTCTSSNSGSDTRVVTSSAHGLLGTETFVVRNNSISAYSYVQVGQYSIVDATTVDVLGYNYGTGLQVFSRYFRSYTPGSGQVDGQNVTDFYLPGVTPGISSPADIPTPAPLTDDATLLTAVIGNASGYVHFDITARDQWMNSPIYFQTVRKINLAKL